MKSKNWLYISQLLDVIERWFFLLFSRFFESPSSNMLLIFHLYDAVTSWRHVMTSQNLIYLSQLLDALESLILFLFPWFFRSLSSKMLLIFNLCDAVTSWRHVMTSLNLTDLPISASRCARKLILFLFPWFFRSLSSNMLLIFHLCDAVTSWRHVMTSLNLIHISQLVDELESWFFVDFWRHDVMTWRYKNCSTYLRLWIHWKDDRVQDSTVFLVAHSRKC